MPNRFDLAFALFGIFNLYNITFLIEFDDLDCPSLYLKLKLAAQIRDTPCLTIRVISSKSYISLRNQISKRLWTNSPITECSIGSDGPGGDIPIYSGD